MPSPDWLFNAFFDFSITRRVFCIHECHVTAQHMKLPSVPVKLSTLQLDVATHCQGCTTCQLGLAMQAQLAGGLPVNGVIRQHASLLSAIWIRDNVVFMLLGKQIS